jgi:hypothetical protein
MVWGPDRISFRSYRGRGTAGPVIATRTLTRASVPVPGNERVIFNLWVTSANADNQHATKTFQAVVTGFTFKPRPS